MSIAPDIRDHVATSFFAAMSPYLDEKLLRLSAGALSLAFGEGSAHAIADAAGLSGTTVREGMHDLAAESAPVDRVRRPGAGRRDIEQTLPGIWEALDALVEPEERGDPENPLRWTVKSTRTLAGQLGAQGLPVSHTVVGKLLRDHGYSLRGTAKVLEGKAEHGPDRDRQFRYINDTTKIFLAANQPVISVDTKKKEPIGNFHRQGQTWRPRQDPVKVADHTFVGDCDTTAVPYGVYDVGSDAGFVNVGVSHDTPTFAIASIRRWWMTEGRVRYPEARKLLVCADSGGSNAASSLVFKVLMHRFALEAGIEITVCHTPPGTSKWNKVEHRLFAQISSNWRGRPLTSLEVVVSSIAATSTRSGLAVTCVLDEDDYPTGVSSNWDQVEALPITFHEFRGAWNYTIAPTPPDPSAVRRETVRRPGQPGRPQPKKVALLGEDAERTAWIKRLSEDDITGIRPATWKKLTTRLETAYRQLREQEATAARGGQPSAYPNRGGRDLKVPFTHLMLAVVLHGRYQLPTAQLSRLIDMVAVSLSKHITNLAALFAEHGHPITPMGNKVKNLEQLYEIAALPQEGRATRAVTT